MQSSSMRQTGPRETRREYPDGPLVGVGALVIKDGQVLMIKRGKPPGKDMWAIPGGLVELGETLQQAAEREVREETGLRVRAGKPVYTFDLVQKDEDGRVRFHYVIIDLEAKYVWGEPHPGDDAYEARWFSAEEIKALRLSPHMQALLKSVRP